ncbi:MAG: GGDEF domain-containing protein [Clostridia bacterium]|nr:GGDEF domain-containing protein [Clostridia bacterium]
MKDYWIAFLTADWNFELVESTLQGLKQYVDDFENIHLCVFDCFGKDLDNERDKSEYAIYGLVDFSRFDGVLVQGNQIVLKRVREELGRRIVEAGIPAVSIDCPLAGCEMFGIDNEKAQYEIANHVLKEHHARQIVYLTGLLDNGCLEGRQRLAGFLSACRDNGIPHSNIEIIECTWRTSDGVTVANQWIDSGKPLPDAFVCANDDMAFGLMEALEDRGYHVPNNVLVTGFDGLTSSELSSPSLSTVCRDNQTLNYQALDFLIRKIEGKETEGSVSAPYKLTFSESCGCGETLVPGYLRKQYFKQIRFLKNFYILQDELAEDLFEANDLMGLMESVEDNKEIFGCGNAYMCINDYYFDNYDKKNWHRDSKTFGEEMVLAECGRAWSDEELNTSYVRFPRKDLLPRELIERERFLIFYPLHYNTYSIGYLVLDGISEAAKLNLHISIFSFLEIAIENVRKKCLLHQFNDFLDNLYVHDALTGLYNRFGYERFGQHTFDSFLMQDGGAQILFIDMDHMKQINDQFGHEIGDEAIRGAAGVIQKACSPRDFMMRYGGDEFLVIASSREVRLEEAIQHAVRAYNQLNNDHPFELSLSVGIIRADNSENKSLEEYVQAADVQMYEQKSRRRNLRN